MAGSFQTNGSNIIVKFEYNVASQIAVDVINNAASLLYTRNFPVDFSLSSLSALTNTDLLGIVDPYVKQIIAGLAKDNDQKNREAIARQDAINAASVLDL